MFSQLLLALRTTRSRGQLRVGARSTVHFSAALNASPGGLIRIGSETHVRQGVILQTDAGSIVVGDRCSINPYCVIYGSPSGTSIGDDVLIGAHCVIVPATHQFSRTDIPIRKQGFQDGKITIENDVWIGANATILGGVIIRQGSIIGAGAVVREDTTAFGIYGGVPAKLIRSRLPA